MKNNKAALFAGLISFLALSTTFAQELPNLTCQTLDEVVVTHGGTLSVRQSKPSVLYRITDGKLYLSSPSRDEYLYGDVVEIDYRRFTVGYKTIVTLRPYKTDTTDEKFYEAMVDVHTDSFETTVRRLHCVLT